MKRNLLLSVAALAFTACSDTTSAPPTAPRFQQGNPGSGVASFDYATASSSNLGALIVAWKQHGVGNNDIHYQIAVAKTTIESGCFNGGSNHPSATNKEESSAPTVADVTLRPRNGGIETSFTFPTPAASDFCPEGQAALVMSALYEGISLLDVTNDILAPLAPTTVSFTATLPSGHGKNN